ncbi:MAG TPA: CocE/NonD family hydrolase, partial [Chitinophagaceae bacterium]
MKYLLFSFSIILGLYIAEAQDIDIKSGIKIKLRDSLQLNATLYLPHDQKIALPVIFALTPYISDSHHARAVYFARHGYIFAVVDARGRGSSEGIFDPFMQEAKDGYDVTEWMAKQSFCDSKVAMWGGSYLGYDQWATAKELPPHLVTIVPVSAVCPGFIFPMTMNIGDPYSINWLCYTSGKTGNSNLHADDSFWESKYMERYLNDLPFAKLDSLVGNTTTVFQKWILHPMVDDYWKSFIPSYQQYASIKLPMLTITGCYDDVQPGALKFYRDYIQHLSPAGRKRQFLIIGPWDHLGTRSPKKEVGGLRFGEGSLLDLNKLHWEWYNYIMKDSAKPGFLKNQVAYYVTNRDKWEYAESLDKIGENKILLYLDANGDTIHDIRHPDLLAPRLTDNEIPAGYVYNPLDKRFSISTFGNNLPDYLTDQTGVNALLNKSIVYQSDPWEIETEVSGFFKLDVYIETDVRDLDLEAAIYEIKADSSCVLLTSNFVRARYRESLEKEKLLIAGDINLFHFEDFPFISRVIEKGSK